jgi:hypothetical protein
MASTIAIPARRAFILPRPDDSWESIAARQLPDTPRDEAVTLLKSWNVFLVFRPGGGAFTPSDVMFVAPPSA